MSAPRKNSQMKSRHAVVLWLLFMALFARGLLPGGTMLALGGAQVSIVLCTPQGALTSKDATAPQVSTHGDTCPFGFALAMAAAPTAEMPTLPQADTRVAVPAASVARTVFLAYTPYAARAPPAFS